MSRHAFKLECSEADKEALIATVQLPKLLVPYNPTTPHRFTPDARALVFLKDIDGPRSRNFYWVNLKPERSGNSRD